jgi:hypothetical protein
MTYVPPHTLKFGKEQISCTVLAVPEPAPELQTWRTRFAGVQGESELVGTAGGRTLEFALMIHGSFATRNALRDYIQGTLNGSLIGEHDDIVFRGTSPNFEHDWMHCTCEGFSMAPGSSPLFDFAGTLDGGWFVPGVLRFRQLYRDDDD